MDPKWIAAIAIAAGLTSAVSGYVIEGTGPMSRDPISMLLIGGGALSTGAGITYLLYRGLMAL